MAHETERDLDALGVSAEPRTLRSDLPADVIPSAARIHWDVLQNQNLPGSPAYLKISAARVARAGASPSWAAGSDTGMGDPSGDPRLENPEVRAHASARWNELRRDRTRDGGPFKVLYILHLAEVDEAGTPATEMYEVNVLEARAD